MENTYRILNYTLTGDSSFQDKKFGVTPELKILLQRLPFEISTSSNPKLIDKLNDLIIKYPANPVLKNYLSNAYIAMGNVGKAREVNAWLLKEHPDYLFARINQAFVALNEKRFEDVPVILGKELELKDLYPERDLFHIGEFVNYYFAVIHYYCAIGNVELAENRLEVLKKADINGEVYKKALEVVSKTKMR